MASLIQTLAVAEYLNFRHAAIYLGVSQSSVSTRIKTLEDDLGTVRAATSWRAPDRCGAEFHHGGRGRNRASRSCGQNRGRHIDWGGRTLHIGLHSSVAVGFLADLRRRFREKYQDIELVIAEGTSAETIRQVRDGAIDIAFVMGAIDAYDCHSRPVWNESLVIVLPVHHPMATTESLG